MMPCPCCGRVLSEEEIVPDGTYQLGSTMLVSFKCIPPCLTNRALRFDQVSSTLRRAAMLADLALRPESPEMTMNDPSLKEGAA